MAADVIVFVRAPRIGTVKTRLAKTVGEAGARDIYQFLLSTICEVLDGRPRVTLRYCPDDALELIQPWLRPAWAAQPQGPGDLGERMHRAFMHAFAHGAAKVVVIGSDCPEITPADIDEAFRSLATHDLVLGPASDGGYWLIGLAKSQPSLFQNISWSSKAVLAQTLSRATVLGLRVRALRVLSDIDTAEDWNRYQRMKAEVSGTPAPN